MLTVALLLVLLFARGLMLMGRDLDWSLAIPFSILWQDFAVVTLFGFLSMICQRFFPNRGRTAALSAFILLAIYTSINVAVVRVLGAPITPTLLRAADGALSDSITHYLTLANLLSIASILGVAAGALAWALCRKHELSLTKHFILVLALSACALVGRATVRTAETHGFERNALFALFSNPALPAPTGPANWNSSAIEAQPSEDLRSLSGIARGRNVILIALESTGASHLRPWGSETDLMPTLTELTRNAIVFENAYAVYPESIKGFYSVLCSSYPAFNTRAEDYEHRGPDSLAHTLRDYRSALFHSGRFDYLGMEEIIRQRGFDELHDAADLAATHESSFGVDDEVTVDAMLRWLDRSIEPFFLTYLPVAGHHPYITPGNRGGDDLERYRQALGYSDRILNRFINGLKERGLFESSLFIIYGDHGEAFNEHQSNIGHTLHIYEENVRVPLTFIAPGALQGERRVSRPVSLVDLAPTVTDLLGTEAAPGWQGASLLSPEPRPAFLLTDYSQALLGLRDGNWKFIYELETRRARLYDLAHDPAETTNLASQRPDLVARFQAAVLSWSSEQRDRFELDQPRATLTQNRL